MDGICLSFDFLIDVREPHPESFGTATRRIKTWVNRSKRKSFMRTRLTGNRELSVIQGALNPF